MKSHPFIELTYEELCALKESGLVNDMCYFDGIVTFYSSKGYLRIGEKELLPILIMDPFQGYVLMNNCRVPYLKLFHEEKEKHRKREYFEKLRKQNGFPWEVDDSEEDDFEEKEEKPTPSQFEKMNTLQLPMKTKTHLSLPATSPTPNNSPSSSPRKLVMKESTGPPQTITFSIPARG